MKIKKSQLKIAVKEIVREAIAEKCGGGGHLAGGAKGERMFKHIKQGYQGEKDPETASKIAAATVNKNLGEAGLTSEMGPESKLSILDDIVKLCIKKFGNNDAKIQEYVPKVFKAHTGWDADPEAVAAAIQRGGSNSVSEDGAEGGEHAYDEKEEVLLIKVMKLIADKLSAMHGDQEVVPKAGAPTEEPSEEPSEAPPFGGGEEEPAEEPAGEEEPSKAPPFGGGEKEEEPEEPSEEPEGDDDDDKEKVDEEAYKVVAPRSYEVQQDNKALTIQTDPKVNEASFKKVAKKAYTDAKEDKARRIQTEPDVNENHKVQARSHKTVNDQDNDPQNVRDPEVPQA